MKKVKRVTFADNGNDLQIVPTTFKCWMGTTKGEIMAACYGNDKTKLANVDCAIPKEFWSDRNTFWWVMDYNNSALGELRNLQDVARENNVKLIFG